MNKLEKLEKVVPMPDTTFYGAYYFDGEDIELCNDIDEEGDTYISVKDRIKNNVLYKVKELKVKQKDGRFLIETTKTELPLNVGDMLIYVMYEGFVQTKTKMVPVDKAIERYELLKSPVKE